MKRLLFSLLFSCCVLGQLSAQTQEAQQLLLNVEKLAQLKQVLSDMKKGYQVLSSGYGLIRDVAAGNFELHRAYLDGLLRVSPAVRKYEGVARVLRDQALLVQEYRRWYRALVADGGFTAAELAYLQRVYSRLLSQSRHTLEALTRLLSDGQLRMSDRERLEAVDRICRESEEALLFLRQFNKRAALLALQRARERRDVERIRLLYGLPG